MTLIGRARQRLPGQHRYYIKRETYKESSFAICSTTRRLNHLRIHILTLPPFALGPAMLPYCYLSSFPVLCGVILLRTSNDMCGNGKSKTKAAGKLIRKKKKSSLELLPSSPHF
jgi:hypothetical protein